jgi:hypothetical protein
MRLHSVILNQAHRQLHLCVDFSLQKVTGRILSMYDASEAKSHDALARTLARLEVKLSVGLIN